MEPTHTQKYTCSMQDSEKLKKDPVLKDLEINNKI